MYPLGFSGDCGMKITSEKCTFKWYIPHIGRKVNRAGVTCHHVTLESLLAVHLKPVQRAEHYHLQENTSYLFFIIIKFLLLVPSYKLVRGSNLCNTIQKAFTIQTRPSVKNADLTEFYIIMLHPQYVLPIINWCSI